MLNAAQTNYIELYIYIATLVVTSLGLEIFVIKSGINKPESTINHITAVCEIPVRILKVIK